MKVIISASWSRINAVHGHWAMPMPVHKTIAQSNHPTDMSYSVSVRSDSTSDKYPKTGRRIYMMRKISKWETCTIHHNHWMAGILLW